MTDLSLTVAPKSDQTNADDLIGGPRLIKVVKVSRDASNAEQPIVINYENDNGRPYKPCKGMRRVLINAWGKDGSKYVGRSMMLFRNPGVLFGGQAVGGIQIAELSDIDAPITMALTATRASRKPFTVKPLTTTDQPVSTAIDVSQLIHDYINCVRQEVFEVLEKQRADVWQKITAGERNALKASSEAAKKRLTEMVATGIKSEDAAGRGEQDETS
jgi:hypothetical protein